MRARASRSRGRAALAALAALLLVALVTLPARADLEIVATEQNASIGCRPGTPGLCDDGDPCTTNDVCVNGFCIGTPVRCEDGNVCNGVETCDPASGACVSGPPPSCDDGNPCTDDGCDPKRGCEHSNNRGPCDDGSRCTTADVCRDGTCAGVPLACDDGDACNGVEICEPVDGSCRAGTPLVCDDGNPCTDDACAPRVGCVHANNTASCDDGSLCTTGDTCRDGACVGKRAACDDGNACNGVELCDELTGRCVPGTPPDCADADARTTDACDPVSGCVHAVGVGEAAPADTLAGDVASIGRARGERTVSEATFAGDLLVRAAKLMAGVRRLMSQGS